MFRKSIFILFCLVGLNGCMLYRTAAHNLINEPVEFFDSQKLHRSIRTEAEQAWRKVCLESAFRYSEAYGEGFVDGYADYLESGGKREPPAVPPLKYRRSKYLNPTGHALIRDYYVGFKNGVEAAFQSGKRQYLTVPVLMPEKQLDQPLTIRVLSEEECRQSANPRPLMRPGDQLPQPRELDPETGLPRVPPKQPSTTEPPQNPLPKKTSSELPDSIPMPTIPSPTTEPFPKLPGLDLPNIEPSGHQQGELPDIDVLPAQYQPTVEITPPQPRVIDPNGQRPADMPVLPRIMPLRDPPAIEVRPLVNPPK